MEFDRRQFLKIGAVAIGIAAFAQPTTLALAQDAYISVKDRFELYTGFQEPIFNSVGNQTIYCAEYGVSETETNAVGENLAGHAMPYKGDNGTVWKTGHSLSQNEITWIALASDYAIKKYGNKWGYALTQFLLWNYIAEGSFTADGYTALRKTWSEYDSARSDVVSYVNAHVHEYVGQGWYYDCGSGQNVAGFSLSLAKGHAKLHKTASI